MAGHALYGMAPCFGHTGVTFDVVNDRPGPGCLRGHFEATRGHFRVCPVSLLNYNILSLNHIIPRSILDAVVSQFQSK